MPDPIASISDVRTVVNLPDNLDDQLVQAKLDDAAFQIYHHNDAMDFSGESHRKQAEKKLAALMLIQYVRDARSKRQESLGSAQLMYEGNAKDELRREVIHLIPNADFLTESKPTGGISVPDAK